MDVGEPPVEWVAPNVADVERHAQVFVVALPVPEPADRRRIAHRDDKVAERLIELEQRRHRAWFIILPLHQLAPSRTSNEEGRGMS